MYHLLNLMKGFIKDEEGATVVEYGILVALIIAACIIVIGVLGNKIENLYEAANSQLS